MTPDTNKIVLSLNKLIILEDNKETIIDGNWISKYTSLPQNKKHYVILYTYKDKSISL